MNEQESTNDRQGWSLHIGVNSVDPEHYCGWDGPLASCENDADTMETIARMRGFRTRQLKTVDATRENVSAAIEEASAELGSGDFFLVSYAGHGGQLTDRNFDEVDGKDDTWCLFNGQLIDDELNVLFAGFLPGVRVLVVSDSCHSGTLLKGADLVSEHLERVQDDFIHSRKMPRDAARATREMYRAFYRDIQRKLPQPRPRIRASVRLLSGCQETQESFGNKDTGRFTAAIKDVFENGEFQGNYHEFHQLLVATVAKAMNPQTPGHGLRGGINEDFDRQPPFTI